MISFEIFQEKRFSRHSTIARSMAIILHLSYSLQLQPFHFNCKDWHFRISLFFQASSGLRLHFRYPITMFFFSSFRFPFFIFCPIRFHALVRFQCTHTHTHILIDCISLEYDTIVFFVRIRVHSQLLADFSLSSYRYTCSIKCSTVCTRRLCRIVESHEANGRLQTAQLKMLYDVVRSGPARSMTAEVCGYGQVMSSHVLVHFQCFVIDNVLNGNYAGCPIQTHAPPSH